MKANSKAVVEHIDIDPIGFDESPPEDYVLAQIATDEPTYEGDYVACDCGTIMFAESLFDYLYFVQHGCDSCERDTLARYTSPTPLTYTMAEVAR